MKNKLKSFWTYLLQKLDSKINQYLNKYDEHTPQLNADDDTKVNYFAMILRKVINRALMGATFEVTSDSTQTEPLKELCSDLQENVYKITTYMLSGNPHSECWVVPSFINTSTGNKLIHSYVSGDRVCITAMSDDNTITEAYIVLNTIEKKDKTYFLCRKHNLDESGTLRVSYFISDELAREINADIEEWAQFVQTEIVFQGANHIGFGRYKSPVMSYGNDNVYGVPLNYGCREIENRLQTATNDIAYEMKSSKKMLFPDWSIVRTKRDKNGNEILDGAYSIDEYIFPIQKRAGMDGSLIDEYAPTIRTEYRARLDYLLKLYQYRMGVQDLITESNDTTTTAYEIFSKNTDNISLEESIRKAIRKGNLETLKADALYLGIRDDLWQYEEDFKNIYEDEQKTISNYQIAQEMGWAEKIDGIKYWNPTLTQKEAEEKLQRIQNSGSIDTQQAIEDMLNLR